MERVLFVDVRNTVRGPMAEAWFNHLARDGSFAYSCGTMPASVSDPLTIQVMKEVGLELTQHVPRRVNQQAMRDADMVILVGREVYPQAFAARYVWDLSDPSEPSLDEYRKLRDALYTHVQSLVEKIEPLSRSAREWDQEYSRRLRRQADHDRPSNMLLLWSITKPDHGFHA